jgi:hypothetical protein
MVCTEFPPFGREWSHNRVTGIPEISASQFGLDVVDVVLDLPELLAL